MNYTLRTLLDGRTFTIFALVCDGTSKIEDFLDEVAAQDEAAWTSVMSFLERCADHGPPKNNEKSRAVGDGIFESKTKDTRICYFYDAGQMIICTHGFYKPQPKVQDVEIKAAKKTRANYLLEKAKGSIKIEQS